MTGKRVPIAWLNLSHNRRRLFVSLAGITFAAMIMFMEFGFLNAMFDGQVELVKGLDAEFFLLNKLSYSIAFSVPFSRHRLYQMLAAPGVVETKPLYIESRFLKLRSAVDQRRHNIRVLAFDPEDRVFLSPDIERHRRNLRMPKTAILDRQSKEFFGKLVPGDYTELASQRIQILGTFELGTDLVNDGNLIVSDHNFASLFPARLSAGRILDQVDLGLVKLDPKSSPDTVRRNLEKLLPGDVTLLSRSELVEREIEFWKNSTIVGFTFWLAMMIGFAVGVAVCYQILYTAVIDFLPQYGILKAIGYPDRFLILLVLKQALILAVLGFLPGLLFSFGLYGIVHELTGLPMRLNPYRISVILALTVAMCVVSALLAMWRALAADPTEVFE